MYLQEIENNNNFLQFKSNTALWKCIGVLLYLLMHTCDLLKNIIRHCFKMFLKFKAMTCLKI